MDETRVLIVVKEGEAQAAYEEAIGKTGVSYDIAPSFNDVLRLSTDNAYSGMLIDILTLIRSSKEEKSIAYDCINYYPSVRAKWDARNKSMNLSPLEEIGSADTVTTLSAFIEQRCKPFTARSLRRFVRKEVVLSLLLSSDPDCAEQKWLRTFTVNVSEGGAFVQAITPYAKGETVWLRLLDLAGMSPIRASVCWGIEWGTCRSIPGVGVCFEGIAEQQLEMIKKIAAL